MSPAPALSASPLKKAVRMEGTPGRRSGGLSPVDIISKLGLSLKKVAAKGEAKKAAKAEGGPELDEAGFRVFDPDI